MLLATYNKFALIALKITGRLYIGSVRPFSSSERYKTYIVIDFIASLWYGLSVLAAELVFK